MLLNHLKIAFRSLKKNKIYTGINWLGLTIGMAAALLIFQVIKYESSFNQNFPHYEEIVRVIHREIEQDGSQELHTCIPIPAMDVIEETVPQFSVMSRVKEIWSALTVPGEQQNIPSKKFGIEDRKIAFAAENSFFEVFELNWLAGDASTALREPGTIVLTKSWAEKCFVAWENAMGKTVFLDHAIPLRVEGVIPDFPSNCDFPVQYIVSYPTLISNSDFFFHSDSWNSCSSNDQIYARLPAGSDVEAVNATLGLVGAKEYAQKTGFQRRFHQVQYLKDLHYNDELGHSGTHQTSRSRLQILSMIGLLILIMACFNFINLATAQASLRAKEVGVRKTLGGQRSQLISQFMTETATLVGLALLTSALLASLFLPGLSLISHVPTDAVFLQDPRILVFLFATFLGVTSLAGLYPALLLSGFHPIKAISNNQGHSHSGGKLLRKSLVVLQFTIAQALIIAAIITILQMDYIQSKDLGFDQNLVYTFGLNNDSTTLQRQDEFKQRLKQIPGVISVSFNSDQPLSDNTWSTGFRYANHPENEAFNLNLKFADEEYQQTYSIPLISGRWYEQSDTMRQAVINKTLVRKLGIEHPEEALGQTIHLGSQQLRITGVTDEFHTHSFRTAQHPLLISTFKSYYWDAGVKIHPQQMAVTTAAIQSTFDEFFPEQIFEGRYLDERIAAYYLEERRQATLSKVFGLLAIFISCLGLFGLATHATNQRLKEIGIRKVLGASVAHIISLLSSDFIRLVLFALVLSVPIAYYTMESWLTNFVYRVTMPWWVFGLTGFLALGLALLTVSYHSIRAALANPINSLKDE